MNKFIVFKVNAISCNFQNRHLIDRIFKDTPGNIEYLTGLKWVPYRKIIYSIDIILQVWVENYPRSVRRKIVFMGSKGLFLLLENSNKVSLQELDQAIEDFIKDNNFTPAIVILGISKISNEKKLDSESIKNYIKKLSKNYDRYIPYMEIELDNFDEFDENELEKPLKYMFSLVYFVSEFQKYIRNKVEFENYDFLFDLPQNKDKYEKGELIKRLKEYIEFSPDEIIQLKSLQNLRELYFNDNYFQGISNNPNLYPNTRIYSKLIYFKDTDEMKNLIFNSESSKFLKELIIELNNDSNFLENICLNHTIRKLKEIAFNRLILLGIKSSMQFYLEIIWKIESKEMKIKAVEFISNEDELVKIIFDHPKDEVKAQAVKMLKEPISQNIKDLIYDDKYHYIVKKEIVAKINSNPELETLILKNNAGVVSQIALEFMKNPSINLIKIIAFGNYSFELKQLAIQKCVDQELLEKILTSNQMLGLRIEALKKLKNPPQEYLFNLILHTDSIYARREMYDYLDINDHLTPEKFLQIIRFENDEKNILNLINKCESTKHLSFMRMTLPPQFQTRIKKRLNDIDK